MAGRHGKIRRTVGHRIITPTPPQVVLYPPARINPPG